MKNHEAMKVLIGNRAAEFARRLGLSGSTVYKWTEPCECDTDSGRRNPPDLVEQCIEIGIALGDPREQYLAPLQRLNERFNIIGIDLPSHKRNPKELASELCHTMTEFADLVRVASVALEDGDISRSDFERIQEEGWQAIRQIGLFMRATKAAAKK
jgi:hypothetical protein